MGWHEPNASRIQQLTPALYHLPDIQLPLYVRGSDSHFWSSIFHILKLFLLYFLQLTKGNVKQIELFPPMEVVMPPFILQGNKSVFHHHIL